MVCQRWCETKSCVKDGVSKMVRDKVVCERWSVTKWCERWCVCVTKRCDKVVFEKWCGGGKVVSERWCVTKWCDKVVCEKWCVTKWCVKDSV